MRGFVLEINARCAAGAQAAAAHASGPSARAAAVLSCAATAATCGSGLVERGGGSVGVAACVPLACAGAYFFVGGLAGPAPRVLVLVPALRGRRAARVLRFVGRGRLRDRRRATASSSRPRR